MNKTNEVILLNGGHKLQHESGSLWMFVPAEDWMPIQLTYGDAHQIIALDCCDMGMPIMHSNFVSKYKVSAIVDADGKFGVILKEKYKKTIDDLEQGDVLYVFSPDDEDAELKVFEFDHSIQRKSDIVLVGHYIEDKNDDNFVILSIKKVGMELDSDEGIPFGCTYENNLSERVFSNPDKAKKFTYDYLQDKIEHLKSKQRKIMSLV